MKLALRFLIALVSSLLLVACDGERTGTLNAEAEHVEAVAQKRRADLAEQAKLDQAKTIVELKTDIETEKGIISDAKQKIADKTKLIEQKEEEHIQAIMSWVAGLLAIAMLAALVAAWFSPIGKRLLLSTAFICAALVPVVLALRAYVHFLPMIGLGILAALGLVAVWLWRSHAQALTTAVDQWQTYAAAVPDEVKARLDAASIKAQEARPRLKAAFDRLLHKGRV